MPKIYGVNKPFPFDLSLIDVKIDGYDFEEKLSSEMRELLLSSNLDETSYLVITLKQWSFLPLRFRFISQNLPFDLVWNTVIMSGLVLLIATWICWTTYRNDYIGRLVLHLQSSTFDSSPKWNERQSFLLVKLWLLFIWDESIGSASWFSREVLSLF